MNEVKQQAEPDSHLMIEMIEVNKWYGQFHVLKDINLQVRKASALSFAGRPARASRPPFAASTGWRNTRPGKYSSKGWNSPAI